MDDILLSLKIISKLPDNGRLCKGIKNIDESNFFTPVRRFIVGDGRKNTIDDIRTLIESIELKCQQMEESKYMEQDDSTPRYPKEFSVVMNEMLMLSNEMQAALPGLEKLKSTYSYDLATSSNLEILMSKMESQIMRLHSYIRQTKNIVT